MRKLNFGCQYELMEGYENYDYYPQKEGVKYIDLEDPLPFKDNSIDEIQMLSLLEHIRKRRELIGECLRVLKPKGVMIIRVPFFRNHEVGGSIEHQLGFTLDMLRRLDDIYPIKSEVIKEEVILFKPFRWVPKRIAYFCSLYGFPINMVHQIKQTVRKV